MLPEFWLCGVVVVCFVLLWVAVAVVFRRRLSARALGLVRLVGFVSLHCGDYASNLAVMLVFFVHGRVPYLAVLLTVHAVVCMFCACTAVRETDWRSWGVPPPLSLAFVVVVLGLMQGVHLKQALDNYMNFRDSRGGTTESIPSMMPARYNCKTLDGILEGTVFAFVVMYALVKRNWTCFYTGAEATVMYASAFLSLLTVGFALMELDHRTSSAVERMLDRSVLAQVRHLAFRASEVGLRLTTILIFAICCRVLENSWWVAYASLGVDYLAGLALITVIGGRDHFKAISVLAIPMVGVNVMQFVDAPGVSLQARRISRVVVPCRAVQVVLTAAFAHSLRQTVPVHDTEADAGVEERLWDFLLNNRTGVMVIWAFTGILYHFLHLVYACRLKPGADLHSAVAYGDAESLRGLLHDSDVVLDVNRYGPDGRTPLHLAAIHGNIDCMRLLIEGRANLHARTGNKMRNTALHFAASRKEPAAVQLLCAACRGDPELPNAKNSDGNTPVHIASLKHNVGCLRELLRMPGVNLQARNAKGQTPGDCATSSRFGFDRGSPEGAVTELLAQASAGTLATRRRTDQGGSIEMADWGPSDTGPGPGSSDPRAAAATLGAAPPRSAEVAPEESMTCADSKHSVPLRSIGAAEEEAWLKRSHSRPSAGRSPQHQHPASAQVYGISSFMLSAGLGNMSRSIAAPIPEDNEFQERPREYAHASFDDFTELKALGEGVFGKVALVKHKTTGELFAMKTMNMAKFKAQKITSTAHSEQFILKTTRHPFVVTLHYAFQGTSLWALVMEYCPHGDLQRQLGLYGSPEMPLELGARFAGEVLLALEHLHSISVIFRDLKLENVVVDKEYRARVTDFGLAKKLNESRDAKTMCGSYGYAAPEIMMNLGKYTYAVDLYSYGVLLYMLASGGDPNPKSPTQRMPPMKHSGLRRKLEELARQASQGRSPRGWWALCGTIPDLLDRLTADEPRKRPSASELKQDPFFAQALGRTVEGLLQEGPFEPAPVPGAHAAGP